jgi:superfamily II DNA or RNA helicase
VAGDNEQILILVKNKDKAGKIFHEFLSAYGIENAYISGDDKKEVINETIQAFNEKRVRILIGSSVIGEGIDVRSTDHLIMCQGGKSEIVIVQAVGRAVRLFPGKIKAQIHDFDFINTKYMRKHLAVREDIYKRNFECEINRFSD